MDLPIAGHSSPLATTTEMEGAEPDLLELEQLQLSYSNPSHTVCKESGIVQLQLLQPASKLSLNSR